MLKLLYFAFAYLVTSKGDMGHMFSSTNTGWFEEDGHFISTTSLYFDLYKNVNQYSYTTYNVALWVSRCKPTYMYVVVWLENKPVHVQKVCM